MVMHIMRGPSGSGKSTVARSMGLPVVSRDSIRESLWGSSGADYYEGDYHAVPLSERERIVTVNATGQMNYFLAGGIDFVVDDTNIEQRYVSNLIKLAHTHGVEFKIHHMDTSKEECIRRNAVRAASGGRFVPESVIEKQFKRYRRYHAPNMLNWKMRHSDDYDDVRAPEEVIEWITKPQSAVIFDIDGTLAHTLDGRNIYDESKVMQDHPDTAMFMIARALYRENLKFFVFSGRTDGCYDETMKWLKQFIPFKDGDFTLAMRQSGDQRPDYVVKHEMFDKHIRGRYSVMCAFDDRPMMTRLWSSMGIKVFNVGNPYIEF